MSEGAIQKRIAEELESLREQLQFRTLEIPVGVNLCSNDYLGLATDPRLKRMVGRSSRARGICRIHWLASAFRQFPRMAGIGI
jgi:7-keto-8-aminopelargonate synthetase-like enzyme